MKYSKLIVIYIFSMLSMASCKKQATNTPENQTKLRKMKFVLYTDKNLSADNSSIVFKPFIENATDQILWDTVLPPMRVKDIPDVMHKLIIERAVPGNDNSTLKVGFSYSIENVGHSRFFESSNAGETFKEIVFNFK